MIIKPKVRGFVCITAHPEGCAAHLQEWREIPYQQFRDRVIERIADLVRSERIKGISAIRDESDLKEPVRIVIEIKQNSDPHVVLNQLYQFSSLQESFSDRKSVV